MHDTRSTYPYYLELLRLGRAEVSMGELLGVTVLSHSAKQSDAEFVSSGKKQRLMYD